VIVPFKDKPELLEMLVGSLQKKTEYENYELLLISNNSTEPQTFELIEKLDGPKIRHLTWDHPFNYPAINNFGARHAKGELLLFLNNDIEVIEGDWLSELVAQASRPEVGAVGAKLLFPSRKIQHAGVVLGMGGFADHVFAGLPDDGTWTAFGVADWTRDYLALTSACLMMRREFFEELGGYDEKFQVCGSDVDLCLRARSAGKQVIYTPQSILVHHESATRRTDRIPVNDFWESFRAYRPYLGKDPYYNPNLSLARTEPWLRDPAEQPALNHALQILADHENMLGGHGLSGGRVTFARMVIGMTQAYDFGSNDLLAASRSKGGRPQAPKRITWFLPFFNHPFGGVHTILRFADLWRRNFGVENTFLVYDNPHVTARELEAKVAMIFDELPGKFEILKQREDIAHLP
jgi:GT2 family glycosyltransferase